jgi:hypothetical protein
MLRVRRRCTSRCICQAAPRPSAAWSRSGLTVTAPEKPVNKPGRRQRAQELAANAIEKMIDPAAPPEERAQRKHRLTKGPSEFREDRVDRPKPKR